MCSQRYLTDERLLGKVFKCLASWFYLGVVPSNDIAASKLLNLLTEILVSKVCQPIQENYAVQLRDFIDVTGLET